jgi:hypothetical protein
MSAESKPPATSSRRVSLWIGSILLLLLVSLAVVGLFEVALRIWWPQQERVIAGNRGAKGDAGMVDSAVGWSLRPGAQVTTKNPEYTVDYQISPQGFRDQVTHAVPKPPNVFRVLLVGDSFTYGIGSSYPDVWGVILERQLAARGLSADIVKAGVPAYDTRTEFLTMQKLVPEYQPDLVVMAFLPNDLFTNTPLGAVPSAVDEEVHGHTFSLQSINLLQRILFHSDNIYTRLYLLTARRQYFSEPPDRLVAGQYAITEDLLVQASRYADSQHCKFAVLCIPQEFQVLVKADGMRFAGIDVDAIDRRLGAFAAEHRFPWLPVMDTMVEKYRSRKADLYYRLDGHLTPLGNHVVGDWLTEQMVQLYGGAIAQVSHPGEPTPR